MKKILSTLLLIGLATYSFGQGLQKGNLLGLHVITVTLKPNASMDEFKSFFVSRVIPDYEKQWTGLRGYLVKSARGDYKNRFAIIWVFETEKARDRYFNADDTPNALELAALELVKSIENELAICVGFLYGFP